MGCRDAFLVIPLSGCGALTSQECGSVVVGKVTHSYQVVQGFPSFSTASLKFQETCRSRSSWNDCLSRLVPNLKEYSLAALAKNNGDFQHIDLIFLL